MKVATKAPVYAVLYSRMAEAARSCGYALAVHGSMERDLDVVAIPWTDEATSADVVVRAMAEVAARRVGGDPVIGYQASSTPRPHGRVGYSFPFVSSDGFTPDGYVDVSVTPRQEPPAHGTCLMCDGTRTLNLSLDGRSGPNIPCPDCMEPPAHGYGPGDEVCSCGSGAWHKRVATCRGPFHVEPPAHGEGEP